MADHQSRSLTPLRPTEILDPYPERQTNITGARQTTHHQALTDPDVTTRRHQAAAHTSFAASLQPFVAKHRRFRAPVASTVVTILGQAVLGCLTAMGTVDPIVGAASLVGWMTCGLGVIAAQCLSLARTQT